MRTHPPTVRPRCLVEDLVIGGTVVVDRPHARRLQRFFRAFASPFQPDPTLRRRERVVQFSPTETVISNPEY